LVLSGNTLYGSTTSGGVNGGGTVFKVITDGSGFRTLHAFNGSDGAAPDGELLLSGDTLFGTTQGGGLYGSGTVFSLNTDGTNYSILHSLNNTNDGGGPHGGLVLAGNMLYGTAGDGGSLYVCSGTAFSLALPVPPLLAITPSGANVILTWPANPTAYTLTLQSATNLVSPAIWNAVPTAPVVVNGQNVVTNPATGTQQFYRLMH
jgi:uncharacterized repeat protein (TIGR03803 family)